MGNPITAIIQYVKSSIAELKKVTWPTRAQTIRYSALVVAVSVGVAVFFASLDYGFSRGILFALSKTPHSTAQQSAEPAVVPDVQTTSVPTPSTATPETSTSKPATPDQKANTPAQPTVELPTTNKVQLPKN